MELAEFSVFLAFSDITRDLINKKGQLVSWNFNFVSLVYVKALSTSSFGCIGKGKQLIFTIFTFMENLVLRLYFRFIVLSNLSGFLKNVETLPH